MELDGHRPLLNDAERLLLVVRRMPAYEFASVFRQELGASELMQVITALPTGRLNTLMDHARRSLTQASPQPSQQERQRHRPLATEIREARKRAGLSQVDLAKLLGIRQSSVSQWERGATERPPRTCSTSCASCPGSSRPSAPRQADAPGPGARDRFLAVLHV